MSDSEYLKRALRLSLLDRISTSARRRIFDLFLETMAPAPDAGILDIGVFAGSEDPDQNFLEKLYPRPSRITAVGIEDASFLERQYPGLTFIQIAPGRPLPFRDGQFEIGFSSAVIEHVGGRPDQAFFLREALRVSRRLFLTTPNRLYPVEFHTRLPLAHWLPRRHFAALLRLIGLPFYADERNLRLLSRRELLSLLPPSHRSRARIHPFRLFGLRSNLILVVNE